MDLAASSVRRKASTVEMSGLGAPRRTATPMPDFITFARVSAASLLDLISPSVWKSTSTATSKASPCSIRRFITAATSVTTSSRGPGACRKPGALGGEPVAGRLLEAGADIADHHLGDARAENLQLGGLRGARVSGKARQAGRERDATHPVHLHVHYPTQ